MARRIQAGDKVISAQHPDRGYLWLVEEVHPHNPVQRFDRKWHVTLKRLAMLRPCLDPNEQKIEALRIKDGVTVIWRLDDVVLWTGHQAPLQMALC